MTATVTIAKHEGSDGLMNQLDNAALSPGKVQTGSNTTSHIRCPFCNSAVQAGRNAFVEVGEYDDSEGTYEEEADVMEYVCTQYDYHIFYASVEP